MSAVKDPNQFVLQLVSHQFQLYSYILAAVPHSSDADDVMQETAIALWEMFDQYQPGTDFGAWARSVARYRVLKFRERKSRAPLLADEELLEKISLAAAVQDEQFEARRKALATCLRKLPNRDRELLSMTYDPRHRTLRQVAEALGRPANTVYKAVSRIHRVLSSCAQRTLRVEHYGG
jgi:RNA polymerase sigma-70 factor (ECF subfamily)